GASGSAAVTVQIRDNGGTANGGVDTSAPQTFTVTTTFANDTPTFVIGPNIEAGNDAGPQTYPSWATQITAGPADESGQLLDFRVTTDASSLFAVLPAIAPDGTLTFTPAANASGTATVRVQLHDNGGTEDGGIDLRETKALKIAATTFVEEAGRYDGPVQAAEGLRPTAGHFGLIRANIDLRGTLSGTMTLGGRTRTFKGQIDASGVAHFAPNNATTLEIIRPGQPTLAAEFKIDVTNGTDSLTGAVHEDGSEFAVITGARSLYTANSKRLPPYSAMPAHF